MPKNHVINEFWHHTKAIWQIAQSQLGYELRHLDEPVCKRVLQVAVGGGKLIRPNELRCEKKCNFFFVFSSHAVADGPSKPAKRTRNSTMDIFGRATVLSAGFEAFAKLALRGVFPGYGGFGITNETRIYPAAPIPIKPKETNLEWEKAPIVKDGGITPEEEAYLRKAASEVGVIYPEPEPGPIAVAATTSTVIQEKVEKTGIYKPSIPMNYRPKMSEFPSSPMAKSTERTVPSTRMSRLFNFGRLAVGLGTGAAAEILRRTVGINPSYGITMASREKPVRNVITPPNVFFTPANAERIVETLCRVRGAALKFGQMLSIQDENTVPRYLLQIFDRVRQSADFMPTYQVEKQMSRELGANWREFFKIFEDRPFAAASIGQVHEAITLSGERVAVKVQYPGVADGIDSDIDNLLSILNVGKILPKGMFLENFASVARRELKAECDYEREAKAMGVFRKLLADDPDYYVPGVFPELSTKRVLTAEFVEGKPVDLCEDEPKEVRDWISTKYMELCLREMFKWRFMQTDPNWSNFIFGLNSKGKPQLILLDFGATRSYSTEFIDKYMKIIRAAYNQDREEILKWSREIGFLTGYESKAMEEAHCESISIIAETLTSEGFYDFSSQDITARVNRLVPVMLEHRLSPPPEEIYSLHRKLSGAFLLAAKLRACVPSGALFHHISKEYRYGEDEGATIDISI